MLLSHDRIAEAGEYASALMAWRLRWLEIARPKQLVPQEDFDNWLLLAGRGFGKTRIGAEEIGFQAAAQPFTRWAVIAPTQNDVRAVCFEGESGLRNVIPRRFVRSYNSQSLELRLVNGSLIAGYSAEKPDRLRGPQFHGGWGDEVASWGASSSAAKKTPSNRLQDTWDNLQFGLRLGKRPRMILTTTPRPIDFLRTMLKDPGTFATRGSTYENRANLAASAIETFDRIYKGTRRGQQELYAEILEAIDGALWRADVIEGNRVQSCDGRTVTLRDGTTVELVRIAVALDPAVTSEDQSDETGIIVAGLGEDGRIYVLEDVSGKYAPGAWAQIALAYYGRYNADAIVAEKNQGGDLVEANLRAEAQGRYFHFIGVHAKRGKYLRAEPISAYYEKGMVSHVGVFPTLEKQMLNFQGFTGDQSPDRLDALVYGVGELMLGTVSHAFW